MKNIMLITIATLTMATANAYQWNTNIPLKVVNNTTVALQFMSNPNNNHLLFTVQPGTSAYAPTTDNSSVVLNWGGNILSNYSLNKSFNDQPQQGTMSAMTSVISGNINLGQVWSLNMVGDVQTLVLTGTNNGNTMQLTATRITGVGVERVADNINALADVFCLDTGVYSILNQNDTTRCPPYETQVVIANHNIITNLSLYDPDLLKQDIYYTCSWTGGCQLRKPGSNIPGYYMNGFDSVPYSPSNPNSELDLNLPPN